MIGKEVAHYRILDRLGGGGMGVVYKAEDTRLGRTVALKFLNAELLSNDTTRRRFLHEARAAALIDHPNVCHVYEVSETEDGRYFMAMNFCEGRSLRDAVKEGPVPAREAFSIAFGVAQGLWAAHRRGIVHRDIKPANILLTEDGFVRIADFGLALLVGDSRVTTSGVTVGTVAYMSPEQTSNSTVAPNTDIWSLGVTLYEMLTGHLPFRGEVNAAIVYSIVHQPPTPLREENPSVPEPCARIVDRCLEKDPARRYQTIEELLEDMVKVATELGWESSVASATIAPILRERRKRVWTRRILLGAAALVILAGGIAGWKILHPHTPYTTKIRLAVMPFDNLIGLENDALVDGLSDHVTRVARWISGHHDSMWATTYAGVVDASLPKPTAAASAFGANRLITGNVQRVGNRHQIRMQLRTAHTGRQLREAVVPFDPDSSPEFSDSLHHVLTAWFEVTPGSVPDDNPWHVSNAGAARLYLEGLSLFRKGSRNSAYADSAATTLARCVAVDSTFAAASYLAGMAQLQARRKLGGNTRIQDALHYGRMSRERAPRFADASALMAAAFRAAANTDSAEACYLRALQLDPANVTTCERLGSLYASENRIKESEDCYLQAVNENSDYSIAYLNLGVFYYMQGRLDDAASAWRQALTLAPDDVVALNNLGAVQYFQGDWAQAGDTFLRSFRLRPDCESCNNIATVLFLKGDYKSAADYFELALSPAYCDSSDFDSWGNLASALYWAEGTRPDALKTYRRAILKAEEALRAKPDSPEIIGYLIDYYAMTGDTVRAREMIQRAEPFLMKDSSVMYRVGSAYEKLGDRELALHHLGNAFRHGYPLPQILRDPVLADLVTDARFQELIRTESAAEGTQAAQQPQ